MRYLVVADSFLHGVYILCILLLTSCYEYAALCLYVLRLYVLYVSITRAIGGPERLDGMQNGSTNGRAGKQLWYLLLLIPFIATLWVPFYNKMDPQLGGFPFFYWYLLLWVPISAAITAVVYYVTR